MFISLNWLKDFVQIPENLSQKDLGRLLTLKTAEVEEVKSIAESLEHIVVGKIISLEQHPEADRLTVTKVDVGTETLQIVCGGKNLRENMLVAVTKIGAKVRWHGEGELIEIKKTKLRGVDSEGMIAAGSEIGIDDPAEKTATEAHILDLTHLNTTPGTPLSTAIHLDDTTIEIDNKSLTHRPDLWGHEGIAREIAVITDGKFTAYEPQITLPSSGQSLEVKIETKELCPRYCGLIIENIKIEQSPDWLKQRLKAIGHGNHNNIVDITNYVMAALGQPMHAFDANNIDGKIIVRTAKKGETITTLDGTEHKLSEEMLLITDDKKPLAIAGVMGGIHSGINEQTTTIILESANFSPSSVRRTSTKLGLRTDSVQRFEKSLDPLLTERALKYAAELILKLCPEAKIKGPLTDAGNFQYNPLSVNLDFNKVRAKIGIEITDKEITTILKKLGFETNNETITIPSWRATKDVNIQDDLIEEIARIYGYDNIPATLPTLPAKLPHENRSRTLKHQARRLLSLGLGLDEVYNYSFYGEDEMRACLIKDENHIKLQNFLSADQTHMRTSLVPNLLKNARENSKNFPKAAFYEIGRTYQEIGDFMPLEQTHITALFYQKGKTEQPFYQAKGALETLLQKLQISDYKTAKEVVEPTAHPHKALSYIDHKGQTIAKIFLLHPLVAKNHDLEKYATALFDLNFTALLTQPNHDHRFTEIPRFPSIEIDVSVLLDHNIEIGQAAQAITKSSPLITNTELFDLYTGDRIPSDKKAAAFKITLNSPDRTLTDEDLEATQKQLLQNLQKIGGEIRGA
ncbi:phenylalanine--tRNA ligase subunit beta [Candidatus Gracilibacteria bacterium]|nr:phenylalanine--tRNA ligase subunit beta [Candidatus Gracilibacteria bacterium]